MSLDRVSPGKKLPEDFNVIIEIPMNADPVKYEVDKDSGAIFVDRFMLTAMHYPCNYGYVPATLSDDGDPVDACGLLGSTAVGVGHVFACEEGCNTSAWIGILVATGTLVATLGTIWVVHANADVREIDSHKYQLERELERIRFSAKLPHATDGQGSPLLSMRFALAD